MRRLAKAGAVATTALVVASLLLGCGAAGPSPSNPTAAWADCLVGAGARIAFDPEDLDFVRNHGAYVPASKVHPDPSGSLSLGSYEGRSGRGGWTIYYAVRLGYRVSLATLVANPSKAAKVVAYMNPVTLTSMRTAGSCG